MKVSIVTFGVKHRTETTRPICDVYFDCQDFPNPTGGMYNLNGTQDAVKQFLADRIRNNSHYLKLWNTMYNYIVNSKPSRIDVTSQLKTVGLFCFGGRHRSVGTAELLRDTLMENGFSSLVVSHEDIHKSSRYSYANTNNSVLSFVSKPYFNKSKKLITSTTEIFDVSKSNAPEI